MFEIEKNQSEIVSLCKRLHVKNLDIFGSAARGALCPESDIDVLVRFDDNSERLFDRYFELKEGLEKIYQRTVDVVIEDVLKNPFFKTEIERDRKNVFSN